MNLPTAVDLPDVLSHIWTAATTAHPIPTAQLIAATGVVALLVVASPIWRLARHLITIAHEGGHAVMALLSGRRLRGVSLHADTSGVTRSSGRGEGPGLVLTLLAGYPAAGVLGLGAAWLLRRGFALGLLWGLVALLALLLLAIRNLFGAFAVLVAGALLVAAATYLPATVQTLVAYFLTWLLLLGAIRAALELSRARAIGASLSDAEQLAQVTRVPTGFWTALFLLLTTATALLGGWLLLR